MEMGGGTHLRGGQLLCPCTDPVLASSAQERLQVWLGTASPRALLGPVQRQQRSPAKTDQFTDLCLTCPLFSLCKRPEEMCCFKYSTTSAPARYGLELEGAAWGVATVRAFSDRVYPLLLQGGQEGQYGQAWGVAWVCIKCATPFGSGS